jgi:hypothetical protein
VNLNSVVVKIDTSEAARELAAMEQRIASINGALQGVSARVAIPAVGELRLLAAAAVGASAGGRRLSRRSFLLPFGRGER